MNRRIVSIVLLFFISYSLHATVIRLKGVYKGENLWVKNPKISSKEFCVTSVYVNDKKVVSNPQTSAYEINLAHLIRGSALQIRIYHKDACEPRILNPQAIKSNSLFAFTKIHVDEEKLIWETKGEKKDGIFKAQQFINGHWETIYDELGHGSISEDYYMIEVKHFSGINRFRVMYTEPGGEQFKSKLAEFRSNKKPVTFYPSRVTDYITFVSEEPVLYAVYDQNKKRVLHGKSMTIDCSKLNKNKYYTLYFDNQKKQFLKKR